MLQLNLCSTYILHTPSMLLSTGNILRVRYCNTIGGFFVFFLLVACLFDFVHDTFIKGLLRIFLIAMDLHKTLD